MSSIDRIKPTIYLSITGTPGSGKTMLMKVLSVWLERSASYEVDQVIPSENEDDTIVVSDRFHRIVIKVDPS